MLKCKINDIKYNAVIKRTFIEFNSNNDNIKVSYFDITPPKITNSTLVIEITCLPDLIITGNNIIKIFNGINRAIYDLRIEFKIGELLTNKLVDNEWVCNICLDNENKNKIELRCCNNILHYDCYLDYLKSNKYSNCPLCRNNKCIVCLGKGC